MKLLNPEQFRTSLDRNTFLTLTRHLQRSIERVKKEDRYLLQTDASERSVCHRLAQYLEDELKSDYPGYTVDVEYNRGCGGKGYMPKMLDDKWISIDIAVHIRVLNDNQEYNNLFAIEMKKTNQPREDKEADKERLARLTDNVHRFGYVAGYFLLLNREDLWIDEAYAYGGRGEKVEFEETKKIYRKVSIPKVRRLTYEFRNAADKARIYGQFDDDPACFRLFPRACCGDAACLLGQYLLDHEIQTWYICGMKDRQSHAWLCTTDPAVEEGYYIDITGDQFQDKTEYLNYAERAYVGKPDDFHNLFRITERRRTVNIHDLGGIVDKRLWDLYETICRFIE